MVKLLKEELAIAKIAARDVTHYSTEAYFVTYNAAKATTEVAAGIAAYSAANASARATGLDAAYGTARATGWDAAYDAAYNAAYNAAREEQKQLFLEMVGS